MKRGHKMATVAMSPLDTHITSKKYQVVTVLNFVSSDHTPVINYLEELYVDDFC